MAKQPMTTTNTAALVPLSEQEAAFLRDTAGAGVSTKAADNIVPQVRILQPGSPEIVDGKMINVKAGDFLMGTTVIPGQDGFWFQPCYWDQRWFEFLPLAAGGGFVAAYEWRGETKGRPIPPEGAKVLDDYHFKMGDNELVHYRQWAGLAWIDGRPLERVINFKSTGHTVAREWNNVAREANRNADGTTRALYTHIYHLTTERISNAKGTWHRLAVGAPASLLKPTSEQAKAVVGNDTFAVAMLGRQLYEAFTAGERKAEADVKVTDEVKTDEVPF